MDLPVINKRIRNLIEIKTGGSENAFANEIKVSQGTINRLFREDVRYGKVPEPTNNTLSKIIKAYPEINKEWLLNGKGDMLRKREDDKHIVENNASSYVKPKVSKTEGVPYFDVDFMGGFDIVANSQVVQPSFYINFAPFNDADFWVNITGKSMSPFISHGDIVALKEVNDWRTFIPLGEIYAVVTSNDFRTIKIVSEGKDENHYKLVPYSKDPVFSEQSIPKSIITHLFKVKGSIKKFF